MKLTINRKGIVIPVVLAVVAWASTLLAGRATRVADAIWAHGELYGVILTDTSFKSPPEHSTDIIFNFAGSGLTGQRSISEAAPGDPGYNGGRWRVMAVTFTDEGKAFFDTDGDEAVDFELMDAEQVLHYAEEGLLMIEDTGVRFECPLLPQR